MMQAYIDQAMPRPWVWGEHDCCCFVAGWVLERGHGDPMGFIRGRYDSERSALVAIKRGGGLVKLWTRGMVEAEVLPTRRPRIGDVGVIRRATEDGGDEVAAICAGERWVSLVERGIVSGPGVVLAAWRV